MNTQTSLKDSSTPGAGQTAVAAGAAAVLSASGGQRGPIVLYCDLAIDPAREQEMLDHFHKDFMPAAEKFEGYIDLKMVKLRQVMQGQPVPAPGINYRFQLTYQSEELRQKWIASPTHQHVWPLIEKTVLNQDYLVLLTDSM